MSPFIPSSPGGVPLTPLTRFTLPIGPGEVELFQRLISGQVKALPDPSHLTSQQVDDQIRGFEAGWIGAIEAAGRPSDDCEEDAEIARDLEWGPPAGHFVQALMPMPMEADGSGLS
ncbi:hypothetical protein E4U56_005284 [Claviceps arundinis]|uniref:Uncharacterized protein n=1 Tax=Claviceps arundinis TaxID=1623583 RepID=A0A9P7MW59_9HYPO|nr:hypothetical protein E4U56_005284 [Claviceps arundinis]